MGWDDREVARRWITFVKFINRSEKTRFGNFVGPVEAMRDLAERFGKCFLSPSCSPLGRSEGLTGTAVDAVVDKVGSEAKLLQRNSSVPAEATET